MILSEQDLGREIQRKSTKIVSWVNIPSALDKDRALSLAERERREFPLGTSQGKKVDQESDDDLLEWSSASLKD